jgi:hypothetical protein
MGAAWSEPQAFLGVSTKSSATNSHSVELTPTSLRSTSTSTLSPTRTPTATVTRTPTITATASVTPTPPCFAELCVFKFEDRDGDGVHDPGEPNLAGWTIHVVDPNLNVVTMITGALVTWRHATLTYTVSELAQPSWTQTYPPPPGSHTFAPSVVNSSTEFGNMPNALDADPHCHRHRDADGDPHHQHLPERLGWTGGSTFPGPSVAGQRIIAASDTGGPT